jgi:hypothetical protein
MLCHYTYSVAKPRVAPISSLGLLLKSVWCLFVAFAISGCHRGNGIPVYLYSCGHPEIDPSGHLVPQDPHLMDGVAPQLPKGVALADGCWYRTEEGKLEGSYEKETTGITYQFERKDGSWMLTDTQHWAVIRNPSGLRDKVH